MPRHDPAVDVRHMLDHAREAVAMARGRTRVDLDEDRMLNLAVVRLVEIIGEASRRVPREFKDRHPDIPWRDVAGARDRLIHGYDEIDFDILWNIVRHDLPILIEQLKPLAGDDERRTWQ